VTQATSTDASGIRLESVACLLCGSDRHSGAVASGLDYEYDTSDIEFSFVACLDCGHVYLDPRPTIESAAAIYPRTYYAYSGAHRTGAFSLLGRIKDLVVSRRVRSLVASVPPGGRLLEAGCGDGSLLIAIRRGRADIRLTGLDLHFSEETRAILASHDIDTREVALEDARFSEPFDRVVMNQFIEHLWDSSRCMASINACLRPGGIVSISTPNLDGYDRRWTRDGAWGGYHFPRHLNLFTRASLCRFLEESGFRIVRAVDLVAPLIQVTTVHNVLKLRGYAIHRFFRDSNLAALAIATAVDTLALRLGRSTSNQQVIAEKVAGSGAES
jgi:SAM-dependent methyltransferase